VLCKLAQRFAAAGGNGGAAAAAAAAAHSAAAGGGGGAGRGGGAGGGDDDDGYDAAAPCYLIEVSNDVPHTDRVPQLLRSNSPRRRATSSRLVMTCHIRIGFLNY